MIVGDIYYEIIRGNTGTEIFIIKLFDKTQVQNDESDELHGRRGKVAFPSPNGSGYPFTS